MVFRPDLRLQTLLLGLLLWIGSSIGALADGTDPFGGSAAHSKGPLQLDLTTNMGCGSQAVFKGGDAITIFFRAGKTAVLRLVIVKPNGTFLLFDGFAAQAGVTYRFDGFGGLPFGTRLLKLEGRSDDVTDRVECRYEVVDPAKLPIVVHLRTNRGCGETALFKTGDELIVEFSVEEDAIIRLVNVRPDGEQVLRENFEAKANVVYQVDGNAGVLLGMRTLKLDATAGARTGHAECSFTVVAELPLIRRLDTSKGCGPHAVFKEGEPITIFFQVFEKALVRLLLMKPNGTQVLVDGFRAEANQLYQLHGFAELPAGVRTLKLEAKSAERAETRECTYEVVRPPQDNSITLTLKTNRGCGPDAVFHPDENMAIDFTVSEDSFLRARIVGPGFTQELLNHFAVTVGMRYRMIVDVGEPLGTRTIILDVKSGDRGGHAECDFKVAR